MAARFWWCPLECSNNSAGGPYSGGWKLGARQPPDGFYQFPAQTKIGISGRSSTISSSLGGPGPFVGSGGRPGERRGGRWGGFHSIDRPSGPRRRFGRRGLCFERGKTTQTIVWVAGLGQGNRNLYQTYAFRRCLIGVGRIESPTSYSPLGRPSWMTKPPGLFSLVFVQTFPPHPPCPTLGAGGWCDFWAPWQGDREKNRPAGASKTARLIRRCGGDHRMIQTSAVVA